jgi:hypothetical protein
MACHFIFRKAKLYINSLMSCRCVTPCLDIAHIYSEPPEDYNGLSFYFPQSKPLYQGSVQIADTIYEVWSPNLTTIGGSV